MKKINLLIAGLCIFSATTTFAAMKVENIKMTCTIVSVSDTGAHAIGANSMTNAASSGNQALGNQALGNQAMDNNSMMNKGKMAMQAFRDALSKCADGKCAAINCRIADAMTPAAEPAGSAPLK